jgi:hypothetical protein
MAFVAKAIQRVRNKISHVLGALMRPYLQDYPPYLRIDTLAGNEIADDCYEFGVYRGRSWNERMCEDMITVGST